jgi:RNA polymerase-binding transcription factor DksA
MKTVTCKKCGFDFPTQELELFPTATFCMMCWAFIPDHIPIEQRKQFLESGCN